MISLRYCEYNLRFRHPFGVSSNTRTETTSVLLRIRQNGTDGYGEACMPQYLGENVDDCVRYFEEAKRLLEKKTVHELKDVVEILSILTPVHYPGRAALEMALLDLLGQLKNCSVWQVLKIGAPVSSYTSYTIALGEETSLAQKIAEARDFAVLKIKAGTKDDRKLIETIRKYTDKPLYIDVNQGWTDKNHAADMMKWLENHNVLLVEQPMPRSMKDDMKWVSSHTTLPSIADESVKNFVDLLNLEQSHQGINIKLMKCGGIMEALKMIDYCRKNQVKVMLGCMAESSCATAAMAQLLAYADFVDLDAPLLYTNDPFQGLSYEKGELIPNTAPGLGIVLQEPLFG